MIIENITLPPLQFSDPSNCYEFVKSELTRSFGCKKLKIVLKILISEHACIWQLNITIGGSRGGHCQCAPPPQQDPILSFSHTFLPKSAKVGGWCPPPMENPGSTTDNYTQGLATTVVTKLGKALTSVEMFENLTNLYTQNIVIFVCTHQLQWQIQDFP